VHYCSLACYKGDKHKSCSETFYQAEYASNLKGERASDDERRQTLEMLQRQRQLDIEYEADGFTGIDSGEQVEQGDDDFADRFGSLDLDKESAEGVWAKLSAAEQQKFLTIVQTGAIEQLLRAHEPWWIEHKAALVLEENEGGEGAKDGARKRPAIVDPLPKLRDLVKSDPSPQLPFNLIDVLFAYAVVVRRYSGDHTSEQTVRQAVSDVLQLSIVLQQKSAFVHESVPSAAAFCTIRAIDELKMRGHAAATALEDVAIILRGTLTSDVCAALSELHGMFRSCKVTIPSFNFSFNLFNFLKGRSMAESVVLHRMGTCATSRDAQAVGCGSRCRGQRKDRAAQTARGRQASSGGPERAANPEAGAKTAAETIIAHPGNLIFGGVYVVTNSTYFIIIFA